MKLHSRRLDGRLAPPEARALDAHLATCAGCARAAAALERAWKRLEALPAPGHAPGDFAAVVAALEPGRRGLAGWLAALLPSPRPALAAAVAVSILVGATAGVRLGRAALGARAHGASPEALALSDGFGLLPFGSPAAGLARALTGGTGGLE